jgi:cytochrome c oxidase subunit 2
MQMRPMAMSFHNDQDLQAVAAYVANLPRPSFPAAGAGDAAKGQTLYTPCTACHGADGAGNVQLKAPPLKGQADWYLLAQLKKFKAGHRGANPADLEGAQMRPMAATLADEQAMQDVVAHIMTLK